ncbi:carboxylesterase family protein [Aurantivibrio infirmus]
MQYFLVAIILFSMSFIGIADPITLNTPQGKLLGETVAKNNVQVFKGIPYALPPVGERRWKPAEPAPAWTSVRRATQFGFNCMQEPRLEGGFFYRPSLPMSEDCLYLNVWAPTKSEKKLPVMVWIHGGALTRGGGDAPAYDGAALAQKDVVVVTINYRLDVFGHLAHNELSAESANKASGNYATTDQIQALKWVQENIGAFGGDKNNVTIFGESAGSWSVTHLVASPLAKNLFHKAIGQSGTVLGVMPELTRPLNALPSAEMSGNSFMQAAGVNSLVELRALPAHEILSASSKSRFRSAAVVDGWLFPQQIYSIFEQGKQNAVPVIVGFNADEGTTLGVAARIPESVEKYLETVKVQYGSMAEDFLTLYPAENLKKSTFDSFRDGFVTWSMQSWAMMTANVNQPAYLYYFSHRPSGPDQDTLGAYHAAEISYVFNNYPSSPRYEKKMANIMSDYWVSFAYDGTPNSKKLPEWQPYKKDNRNYIEFNSETKRGAIPSVDLFPGIWEFHERAMLQNRP